MKKIEVCNPFGASVYHAETVTSTMDISRKLEADGEPHGTVILADFQEAGRGRGQDRGKNRTWEMQSSINLPFTILLRYPGFSDIPSALTLRAGLAVSLAIEDFAPSLSGSVFVKWPNDVMIGNKKVSGIICEIDSGNAHLGIGVNVAQKEFPAHLQEKAISLTLATNTNFTQNERFILLEKILTRLYDELENKLEPSKAESWKPRLEKRLYKIGEQVTFIEGSAGAGKEIKGRLSGIGANGELIIVPIGEEKPLLLINGEIRFCNDMLQ